VLAASTIGGCSGKSTPRATPTGPTPTSVAVALAAEDHAPHQVAAYTLALEKLRHHCGPSSMIAPLADRGVAELAVAHLPKPTRLGVLKELEVATKSMHATCSTALAAYLGEVARGGAPKTTSGWGGYAGSLTAFAAVHPAEPGQSELFLPKLANGKATYQVYSGSPISGMFRRFYPPVSQATAVAVVLRDLVPQPAHSVYTLQAAQCDQQIFAGDALGKLTGSTGVGVFLELTSGRGVGKTKYDATAVDQVRLTPGGAIGGQPCT
jgi:hypothetical protein